jgi:hypothetical protein
MGGFSLSAGVASSTVDFISSLRNIASVPWFEPRLSN